MNWTWEPSRWKKSTKVLLALATVWPPIYMVLFFVIIFSFLLIAPFADRRANRDSKDIDVLELDRKIRNGEIKELIVTENEVIAIDRATNRQYRSYVGRESTREEILKDAQEQDANGRPRVEKIEEERTQPAPALLGFGFAGFIIAHFITILLMLGLMPFYIVLVVKSERLDQTMRIVWVVLICMLGMFAMPAYWYLYVWRNGPPSAIVANPS